MLAGSRVTLRPLRPGDVPRIVEACSDERTAYWLGRMPSPYAVSDAHEWIGTTVEWAADGTKVTWAIADPDSAVLLGAINLFDVVPGDTCEVGYWAHPEARGRGVMTEACRLAVGHGVDAFGLQQVTARAAVDNVASRHVIEANGFVLGHVSPGEIEIRGGLADCACYVLSVAASKRFRAPSSHS